MNSCPFCLSTDFKVSGELTPDGNHIVFIRCNNCGCRGPIVSGQGTTSSSEETGEAFKLWVKREGFDPNKSKGEPRK